MKHYKITDAKFRPAIGRPSVTGLSVKLLGAREYRRRYNALKQKSYLRRWTGLSDVGLGHAEYMRRWRALRKERQVSS